MPIMGIVQLCELLHSFMHNVYAASTGAMLLSNRKVWSVCETIARVGMGEGCAISKFIFVFINILRVSVKKMAFPLHMY